MTEEWVEPIHPRAREILHYWFGDLEQTPEYFASRNPFWFWGGEKVDEEIRQRFEADLVAAVEGKLKTWERTPKGCMALIVLLDQFSLNLYREEPRSYLQSELALPIVEKVLREGWDFVLTPAEKVFLYLPLEHSEKLQDQERSVALFGDLARSAPPTFQETMEGYLDYAIRHHRVVKRYGRFPDRNEVFGRRSTPEEEVFLASDESPF